MELLGGLRVQSGITERVEGRSRITGRSREESGITWRVEGREWNYREGQG